MNAADVVLTPAEAQAILQIKDGCDVYSYSLAHLLRGIQRRGVPVGQMQGPETQWRRPEGRLFDIVDPREYVGDGTDQMPYFGAIATPAGIEVALAVLTRPRGAA